MKSTPRVPGYRPLVSIGYKYNSRKFLGFITTEFSGSNEPGDPCLSRFPNIYSNVSVSTIFRHHFLGRYFNAYHIIYNHNRMRQSYLAQDKYWETHSGYLILATTLALGMGITDRKIIFCNGISEGSVYKKISTR